jgi:peptidoglycan/LPS O-acetylase OafA/YrhL
MEPQPRAKPIRFHELDLLRFLAALAVVCYHYTYRGFAADHLSPVSYPEIDGVTRYGYLGVELFFIISGYVVLMSAFNKTVKQFFVSRVMRLYPAFWVACTLTFLVVKVFGPHLAPTDPNYTPYLAVYLKQYAVNMTMLFEYFGYLNLDTAYWSLTYEITFYFLVSLLIGYKLMDRLITVVAGWLLLTLAVYLLAGVDSHSPAAFLFITKYSPYFAAGMLFYLLQNKLASAPKIYVLLLASLVLALYSAHHEMHNLNRIFQNPQAYSFVVIAGATVLFFVVFWLLAQRKFALPSSAALALLGSLTYPLYLIHSNIGYVVFLRVGPSLNRWLLLALLVGAMLAVAYLINKWVEQRLSKPLGDFTNRLLLKIHPARPETNQPVNKPLGSLT